MHIAILDYQIVPTSPVGSCHRHLLEGLCQEHDITVFAVDFDNPCPERIRWVRVPALRRPLFLLFISYYLLAPFYFWRYCRRHQVRFDLVQMVESYVPFGTLAYSHFCHRAYLKHHWRGSGASGARGAARWLDHALRSLGEPWTYRRVKSVVVPSRGLARELEAEFPQSRGKVHVIANPVNTQRMKTPSDFNRAAFRQELGLSEGDVGLVFVALGHFERKGLPLLLEAMRKNGAANLKLIVVGGAEGLTADYQTRVRTLGLQDKVVFVGMQKDVRPYLWASDAFAFPSSYEAFSLVCLEAAAADLPLLVSPLHGVEEYIQDGSNGILLERTVDGVAQGIGRFLALSKDERRAMGARAREDVEKYSVENFVHAWRTFYESRA